MTTSKLKSDIAAIACNADGCMIQVEQSEENCTTVEYGRGVSVYFKKSETPKIKIVSLNVFKSTI